MSLIPIMCQSRNEQTPVSKSNDEFESFHTSYTKNNITEYEKEEGYAEEKNTLKSKKNMTTH